MSIAVLDSSVENQKGGYIKPNQIKLLKYPFSCVAPLLSLSGTLSPLGSYCPSLPPHLPHSLHMLQVSALHYSARDRVSEGFRTVASARVLHQPTSCGSEYFYNQCPQVLNLIGTEHSLNRSERRVKNEAS